MQLISFLLFLTVLGLSACDQDAQDSLVSKASQGDALSSTPSATSSLSSDEDSGKSSIVPNASLLVEVDEIPNLGEMASDEDNAEMRANTPEIGGYLDLVQSSLQLAEPVIRLDAQVEANLDEQQKRAQLIALSHPQFRRFMRHPSSGENLRNEVMSIRPTLPGDFRSKQAKCGSDECYRVDMYNYFFNLNSTAIVDLVAKRVIGVDHQENTQPDLNGRLTKLAQKIADNSPSVIKQLKAQQGEVKATMVQIKTALKNSRCERSKHLCVAPTYIVGSRALWAIVDLTELKLVGIKWSELGDHGPPTSITERTLENEIVFTEFCEQTRHHQQGDWQFDYNITSSDGLRLTDVRYKDTVVIRSVKLVDWHVSYSSKDNFGYSDAIGCPMFSSAVVVAYKGPSAEVIENDVSQLGFAFKQDFRQQPWPAPCNYRYEQRFEFYDDGRFRIAMADYGRGCGTDGTYRPVVRIDMVSPDVSAPFEIAEWQADGWHTWNKEQWALRRNDDVLFEDAYAYRLQDKVGQGYLIEPGKGQFGDGGRGDNAYFYATVYHPDKDEGERDLVTLGSCCNTDHQQGPELFQDPPESIVGKDTVLWYVPQIKNDGAAGSEYCWADTRVVDGSPEIKVWPCFAGPMFVPMALVALVALVAM